MPPIVGVTGPVAAGKSALSRRLAGLGGRVIDADALGRKALTTPEVRRAVVVAFGDAVLAKDGSLDRAALAARVFADEAARRRLEGIVHPVVRVWIDMELAAAAREGAPFVVVDCALLFESGLDSLCEETVAVDAPADARRARALAAHGWDEAEVRRREAAQLPAHEKRARADRVVVNDGGEERLEEAARAIVESLPRAGAARRTS
jgi:dephospho-CoA kinase